MPGVNANANLIAEMRGRNKFFNGRRWVFGEIMSVWARVKLNPVSPNQLCGFNQLIIGVDK